VAKGSDDGGGTAVKDKIKDVMTMNPISLPTDSTLIEAAGAMRDSDIGDVIVLDDDGQVCGIVTDRDIVIRGIAEGRDPSTTAVGDVCTRDMTTLSPDDSISDAIRLMRDKAIRRVPVIDEGKPAGIVTIGDLAVARDPDSALADISEAEPDR
jgi:CBS domain-containing protein